MKKLLYLLLITLVACSSEPATKLKTITIGFGDATIQLPETYIKLNADQFIDIIRQLDYPNMIEENKIASINLMESVSLRPIYLCDSLNPYNQIIIQEAEYIKINKRKSGLYAGMLEDQLEKSAKVNGIEFHRMGIKYRKRDHYSMVKLKYKQSYKDNTTYSTQCIISTEYKTFGCTFISNEDVDFDPYINSIVIKN